MESVGPLWSPGKERVERANLSRFLKFVQSECDEQVQSWPDLYDFSIRRPERFWTAVWDFCGIRASGEREPVLIDADRMPGARWFPDVRAQLRPEPAAPPRRALRALCSAARPARPAN